LVEADKPTVVEGVSKDAANDAKAKLEAEGAKAEIK
ncbi:MAG: ribosomal protein L7/L12, partial [Anaerolineae bacterium]|nr:ribosomal protein L7/L12 [Anaerolineae bacterium]